MPTYGLTSTGFLPRTFAIIREEMRAQLRSYYGESCVPEGGILARLIDIVAAEIADLWELGESCHAAIDPDAATGPALEQLCLLTGTLKIEAIASTATLTLTGTPTTLVPSGTRFSTVSTGAIFETLDDVTIAAATAWAGLTSYTVGDYVTNASRIYVCTAAGDSDISGGPTSTDAAITDDSVVWKYVGEGTGVITVDVQAILTGPTTAVAGDITQIENAVGGLANAVNLLDADVGYDDQSDESLRLTREEELAQSGTSTADAIRAALLQLTGVTSATVFYNNTDTTDGDGVPPHCVEALVRGGDNAAIGALLLTQIAAGIGTTGNTTTNPADSQGVTHEIKFSRPTEIDIWVDVILVKDSAEYPSDGDAQIKAAIVAFGDAQKCGKNAVASALAAQAFKIDGVLDVTTLEIGTSNPPTASTTIAISTRELAVYDTSRITVTTSNGTP